jgi:hypothetical protein
MVKVIRQHFYKRNLLLNTQTDDLKTGPLILRHKKSGIWVGLIIGGMLFRSLLYFEGVQYDQMNDLSFWLQWCYSDPYCTLSSKPNFVITTVVLILLSKKLLLAVIYRVKVLGVLKLQSKCFTIQITTFSTSSLKVQPCPKTEFLCVKDKL